MKGTDALPPCTGPASVFHILRRTGYFTALWNKLFRRETLGQAGFPLFDESLAVGEDETWLLRVLPHATTVCFTPAPLYFWGTRPVSASRKECITPASLSVLRAKQMAIEMLQTSQPNLVGLAESRLLNDCYHLKMIAYRTGNRSVLKDINRAFRPVRWSWLVSPDVPPLRKAKVLTMSLLIALHAPASWVESVFYLRRSHG